MGEGAERGQEGGRKAGQHGRIMPPMIDVAARAWRMYPKCPALGHAGRVLVLLIHAGRLRAVFAVAVPGSGLDQRRIALNSRYGLS